MATPSAALAFQFHKGTIKTERVGVVGALCHHFNSIKVQLKHESNI